MADEFDAAAAQEEFSGYLEALRKASEGLESDRAHFRNYKPESENELADFKRELQRHLENSRTEINALISQL